MNVLSEFVIAERELYVGKDNNLFAFSLGQAIRYYDFILIIVRRYEEISQEIISHLAKMKALLSSANNGTAIIEQTQLLEEMSRLNTQVHLEIESFYLFSKIFLDKLAFFLRDYFGLENKMSLISHHDFEKNYEQLKSKKDLIYPISLYDAVVFLQKNIIDFRDDEIVHKANPRTIKGTTSNSKHVSISRLRIYPNERDNQVESLPLTELQDSLDRYVEQIILLIKTNRNKSKFQIHE